MKGICHICGKYDDLTKEHVPPQKAFNNRRTTVLNFEESIHLGPDDDPIGKYSQGGVNFKTLCNTCNNNTGSWYGGRFIDWCYQSMEILQRANGKPTLIYMYYVFLLEIIKQIVTMFFSVNTDQFRLACPELVKFVLDKECRGLPSKYRFYIYYNLSSRLRYHGISARLNTGSGQIIMMSEINYPPFGYVMTIDSEPPDDRLYDITFFTKGYYGQFQVMNLKPNVLEVHTSLPGDYRTKPEVVNQAKAAKKKIDEYKSRNS